jgi:tRNA-dihydrouridine synthase A
MKTSPGRPSSPKDTGSYRFCVAPMMDRTDRHCRYFLRLLSRRARLYTEMVTAVAVTRTTDPARLLDFDPSEHPIALQLGGSNPAEVAAAAARGTAWGYGEINLNIGCPSDRVQSGRFGACLMAEPNLVAECVKAMKDITALPVTIKTRIGIDDQDEERHLDEFVAVTSAAGCDTFIIHARKAWLQGLSPKENREIPPLNYGRVRKLKQTFPALTIVLNGGLTTINAAHAALDALDGVMVGRAAYDDPYMLAAVDRLFYGEASAPSRLEVTAAYITYAEEMIGRGARPHHVLRHIVGLFHGQPGARTWRRTVAHTCQTGVGLRDLIALAGTLEVGEPLAA